MKDELFDKKVRELLESYAETPDTDVWAGIESGLRRRRMKVVWKRISYGAAAAAVLLGLFLTVTYKGTPDPVGNLSQESIAVVETPAVEASAENLDLSSEAEQALMPVKDIVAEVRTSRPAPVPVLPSSRMHAPVTVDSPVVKPVTSVAEEEIQAPLASVPSIYDRNVQLEYAALSSDQSSDRLERPARKPSFSLDASGHLSPTNATGNVDFSQPSYSWGAGNTSADYGIYPIYDIRHYFPVSVGLELKYSFLNDRLGVGLGVNYTFLISDYEAMVSFYGAKYQGSVRQSIHYIGIPLNFYVNILQGRRFTFYANVGCMMEKAVKATYDITDLYAVKYRKDMNPEGVQWSANVGLGLECRLFDFVGLFIDPRLTYFFDCDQPYSVRAEQPLQFNLELGFRFHI